MNEKENIISKKEIIGLNYNRNFIIFLIAISLIIIGTHSYAFSPNWEAFVVTIFGALMLLVQINYLITIGNRFREQNIKEVLK